MRPSLPRNYSALITRAPLLTLRGRDFVELYTTRERASKQEGIDLGQRACWEIGPRSKA